jgi:hypothetical protein
MACQQPLKDSISALSRTEIMLRARHELLQAVSHELRTPLSRGVESVGGSGVQIPHRVATSNAVEADEPFLFGTPKFET